MTNQIEYMPGARVKVVKPGEPVRDGTVKLACAMLGTAAEYQVELDNGDEINVTSDVLELGTLPPSAVAVFERDKQTLEHLEAAHEAVGKALKSMPNHVHSVFNGNDVGELDKIQRTLVMLIRDATEALR